MSTELQRQVSSIRKQHLAVVPLHQGRPSLFLTASEAAAVDVSTIHEAAHSGLLTLQQYDSRFEPYLSSLLHPSSIDLQRETKTSAENKALDVEINALLKLLSLYAVESSTHLVLEYLIRRYRIHEMNTHELLQGMLVAHDTKIFARIVQLCKLEDSPWAFLQGVKTSGVPLPRSALAQRALKDAQLVEILCQYVQSSLLSVVQRPNAQSTYVPSSHSIAGANRILSFFTAVVLEMGEERAFDDARIRHLYLFLVEGLKNKYQHRATSATDSSGEVDILDQWRRSCCMILAQLSLRTPFGKPLVKVVSAALAESLRRCSTSTTNEPTAAMIEIVSTMSILAQQQKLRIGSKVLQSLLTKSAKTDLLPVFISIVSGLKDNYNTVPLTASLVNALASELVLQGQSAAEEEGSGLAPAVLATALCQMLSSDLADSAVVQSILTILLGAVKKQKAQSPLAPAVFAGVRLVVQSAAQRFAADFEGCVERLLQTDVSADSGSTASALTIFLSNIFSTEELQHHKRATEQGGGLLLSLSSAIPAVRTQAMEQFATTLSLTAASTPDVLGVVQAATQNLLDPIAEVAAASWTVAVMQRVVPHLSANEVVELFDSSLSFWATASARSGAVAGKIVVAIFAVLEDAPVLKSVLSAAGGSSQLSGAQWVMSTVVPAALGAYAMRFQSDSANAAQWASTEASAIRVLKQSASLDPAFGALSSVSSKAGTLAAAVSSSKFLLQEGTVELLTTVTDHLLKSLRGETADFCGAAVFSQVLLTATTELSKSGKKNSTEAKDTLLAQACPMVLSLLDHIESATPATRETLLTALDQLIAQSGTIAGADASADIGAYVSQLSAPLSFDVLGNRLLVKLISSSSPAVLIRLGACLQQLQPTRSWEALLRVVLTSAPNGARLLAAHTNPATAEVACVLVTETARHSALQALGAYLHSQTSSTKSLSTVDSQLVLMLLAVAIHLCGSSAAESRGLGLLLSQRLGALSTQLSLPSSSGIATKAATETVRGVTTLLSGRAAIIAVEAHAVAAALASEIFESAQSGAVAQSLCWLAAQFGWSHPAITAQIIASAQGSQLGSIWSSIRTLADGTSGESTGYVALVEAITACVKIGYQSSAVELQVTVASWVAEVLDSAPASKAALALKQHLLVLVKDGLFADIDAEVRTKLFDALMHEQINRPGQENILAALRTVQVSLSVPVSMMNEQLDSFHAQYKVLSKENSSAMQVDAADADAEDEERGILSGLSEPLQRIISVLEAVGALFSAADAERDVQILGEASCKLFAFLEVLSSSSLRSVMLVDYGKALVMDSIHAALSIAGKGVFSSGAVKAAATPGKKSRASSKEIVGASGYTVTRVEADIRLLLSCITSTKATQVQASALKLLQVLLQLSPASVMPSMKTLGELLATSSTHMQTGKEGLIEQILRTFVTFLPEASASTDSDAALMPQCMLQSLCQHFYGMPHHRRSALLKMALSAMKAPSTLAVAVDLLLAHSFAAHEIEASTSSGANVDASSSEEGKSDVMILLSKSAHRRARKELKASAPEELFNLAVELMLSRTPNTQVTVVISLLNSAHRLLDIALSDSDDVSARSMHDTLDVDSSITYCSTLLAAQAEKLDADCRRGHAATLAVLHLELIIEVLENKTFHQALAAMVDAQAASGYDSAVQEYFMAFADGALQLLALSSAVEQGHGANPKHKQLLHMRIEGTLLRVAPPALGRHISTWCHEALRTLQKLMDGPSFVATIQELINHEQVEVRQKALVILGERLEGMGSTKLKNDAEIDLYLDLNTHLRQVVQDFLPTLKACTAGAAAPADFHQLSGLAQSALMCMDVLARFLGKRLDWAEVLTDTLKEIVEVGTTLAALTGPETTQAAADVTASAKKSKKSSSTSAQCSPAQQGEYLKLMGSASLCTATLCSVLGAPSLSFLPTIMAQNLTSLEHTGAQVIAGPKAVSTADGAEEDAHTLWRMRVLLVRSQISAVGILVAQLSKFSHPYIPRILSATMALEGISEAHPERATIREDVDRCLSTIATKIPTRLSIPLLLQSAPTILAAGHGAAARFADLMAEVWQQLDRATVVAHLGPLSTLATLLLDYRRVFGDQSAAAAEVDAAASDAVVEMCLKLTESELKSFLTRLAEWRDVKFKSKKTSDEQEAEVDWRRYARAVSFFSLADSLMGKLKSLFIPIMGVMWGSAIELLGAFATHGAKAVKKAAVSADEEAEDGASKSKKRKQIEAESAVDGAPSALVAELELLGRYILSSVRECCAQDNVGFMDEVRFEKMMQAVVALVPLQRAFRDEATYLTYTEDYVSSCLSALAVAVGKDLLWKPLNHKVLLLTRDSRKAVRIAAVKVLYRLFSEVGDEYLLLLPECLPFLSELMEDSHRDVVAAAAETIRFIEELSGEKLDEYLQ